MKLPCSVPNLKYASYLSQVLIGSRPVQRSHLKHTFWCLASGKCQLIIDVCVTTWLLFVPTKCFLGGRHLSWSNDWPTNLILAFNICPWTEALKWLVITNYWCFVRKELRCTTISRIAIYHFRLSRRLLFQEYSPKQLHSLVSCVAYNNNKTKQKLDAIINEIAAIKISIRKWTLW